MIDSPLTAAPIQALRRPTSPRRAQRPGL